MSKTEAGAPLSRVAVWVEAVRPRTLPASIAPVLVGTAAAGSAIAWRAAAALVVALALQVAVNFANDLSDARRGVDSSDRVGPRRAVSSGLISPRAMAGGVALALGVAAGAGLALTFTVGVELLWVGAAAVLAALAYSGGPRPYASAGLGEVAVFVFFGLVATAGSAYVQTEDLTPTALAAGVPEGMLASALLVVNNLRDIPTDARAGKRTLAVRIGQERTRSLFVGLLAAAYIAIVPVAMTARNLWPLLALATLWIVWGPIAAVMREEGAALIPALGATARLHLVFSSLLAVGLWIG